MFSLYYIMSIKKFYSFHLDLDGMTFADFVKIQVCTRNKVPSFSNSTKPEQINRQTHKSPTDTQIQLKMLLLM